MNIRALSLEDSSILPPPPFLLFFHKTFPHCLCIPLALLGFSPWSKDIQREIQGPNLSYSWFSLCHAGFYDFSHGVRIYRGKSGTDSFIFLDSWFSLDHVGFLGLLDLPVYTEGRAARRRRSACSFAVQRAYDAVIPKETNTATWEIGNIGVMRVAREGK